MVLLLVRESLEEELLRVEGEGEANRNKGIYMTFATMNHASQCCGMPLGCSVRMTDGIESKIEVGGLH